MRKLVPLAALLAALAAAAPASAAWGSASVVVAGSSA